MRFLLPALVDKLAHALKRNVQLLHARGVGAADVPLAALAKRSAGDSRDFVLVQQPLAERLAVQSRLFDAGENVECAQRLKAVRPILRNESTIRRRRRS